MKTTITDETKLKLVGVHQDMSNEAYHAGPGISASDVITMSEGLDYWLWKKSQPHETSDAMELGSATHLLLQSRVMKQPELFHDGIVVLSEINMRTKDGKAAFEELLKANAGKILLSPEDHELAHRMVDAVMENEEARSWLTGCAAENSIFVEDAETGLLLKTRPDYLNVERGYSVNFKTQRPDVTFERQAANMAYDWASSFYCDVLSQQFLKSFEEVHVSVVKAKAGPCRVHVNTIDDDDLQFAKAQWRALLALVPECQRTGIWPAPPTILKAVKIPPYARKVCPYDPTTN